MHFYFCPPVCGTLAFQHESTTEKSQLLSAMADFLAQLRDAVFKKELDVTVAEESVVAKHFEAPKSEPLLSCSVGSVPTESRCVRCPPGTHYKQNGTKNSRCESCPRGTYQPGIGHEFCLKCPNQTSTIAPQSKDLADCKGTVQLQATLYPTSDTNSLLKTDGRYVIYILTTRMWRGCCLMNDK